MIDGLKSYPSYKSSSLPWLGDTPTHWEVKRAKYFFREADDRSTTGEEELLSVSHITGVTPRSHKNIFMFLAESNVGHKVCQPNDVVVNTMWAWMAALGAARQCGIVSPSYAVYRPLPNNGLMPEYLDRLLRTPGYAAEYLCASKGINTSRLRLYPEQFLRIPIIRPPEDEQALIVRFLDHADRQIRRYIRAKQKLIKLLEEQRQAIIHRAVTRGLDPNVRLKPSRVEWLGDVPEHWEVVPLKFLSRRVQNGATPPTAEPVFYENGTVPWYGPSSCGQHEQVGTPVRHLAEAAFKTGRGRLIRGPALLVVVIGATAGRMALLPGDGSTNQQITSYELRTERANPRFVLRQIRGAEPWLRATASTATIPILDAGELSRLPVAVTSLLEQEKIVRHAEKATAHLTSASERTQRETTLLREYRDRLIADVVTGKLDVRDRAARLPEQVEEPEPLDEADAFAEADEDASNGLEAVQEETEA